MYERRYGDHPPPPPPMLDDIYERRLPPLPPHPDYLRYGRRSPPPRWVLNNGDFSVGKVEMQKFDLPSFKMIMILDFRAWLLKPNLWEVEEQYIPKIGRNLLV